MATIQIKSGTRANLPADAELGEPLYCEDSKELFIGNGTEHSNTPLIRKNNYEATTNPTIDDGVSENYSVGSKWINTISGQVFECVDNTVSAAVWNLGSFTPAQSAKYEGYKDKIDTSTENISLLWSVGTISGFDITNNHDNTVTISSGTAMLRTNSNPAAPLMYFEIAGGTFSLTANVTSYITANYNNGSPILSITNNVMVMSSSNKCIVWVVININNTDMHWVDFRNIATDMVSKEARRRASGRWIEYSRGALIAETGERYLQASAGEFFIVNNPILTPAIDTSGSSQLGIIFRDGSGGWNREYELHQVDNMHYDDGSGTLAEATDGHYLVRYIYMAFGYYPHLYLLVDQREYETLTEAQFAAPPAVLPPELTLYSCAINISQVIVQKGATHLSDIRVPATTKFVSNTPGDHNGLVGIQGGAPGEYLHLTSAQYEDVESIPTITSSLNSYINSTLKNNLVAITSPSLTDDSSEGYSVDSVWVNTITNTIYFCANNTASAAVWRMLTSISTSSTNGNIKINNAESTVYTHPSTHNASMISGLATVATSGLFADLSTKPDSLSGYGITDAYTKTEIDSKILAAQFAHCIHVSQTGSNTTGDGSLQKPYLTITKALSMLPSGRSSTNRYAILLGAGTYNEATLALPCWVGIVGQGYWSTSINVTSNVVTLDIASGEFDGNGRISLFNLRLTGSTGINFDLTGRPDASLVVDLVGLWVNGPITMIGRAYGAEYLQMYRSYMFGTITITNTHGEADDVAFAGTVTHNVSNMSQVDVMDFTYHASRLYNTFTLNSDNTRPFLMDINATPMESNLVLNGAGINLTADAISLPWASSSISISNGAVITRTTKSFAIDADHTPTNYTTSSISLKDNLAGIDTALAGKANVPTVTTISSDTNLPITGGTFLVNMNSGNVTLTLPDVALATGEFTIKRITDTANVLTVVTTSSQLIDGDTSLVIENQYDCVVLLATSTQYFIVS